MEGHGLHQEVYESTSQYASCCHTMRKNDGTVRVVQDFRALNSLLKLKVEDLNNS